MLVMDMKASAPKTTGESSRKFGPCEVCRKDVPEVFIAKVNQDYVFGHRACLRRQMEGR